MTINDLTKTVDITFDINEGPKVYVNRININGNTRTIDKVIRRDFLLVKVMHTINIQLIMQKIK
jgi:outer membrane protein insertion porin family